MYRLKLLKHSAIIATTILPLLALAEPSTSELPKAWLGAFSDLRVGMDTAWVLITAMLIFWMNAGFAMLESGLCQAKNATNVLAKNFIVFAVTTIAFWIIGWGLMFGDGNPYLGIEGLWFVNGEDNSPALGAAHMSINPFSTTTYQGMYSALNWTAVPLWAKFFFQLVFAGTAATIVSGAVAERIRFDAFLLFSLLLIAFIYPISGHWIWGGGWLSNEGFRDFAGSTVVHSVGGWAALAGVLVLGPRLGKFRNEKIYPIPGHNMTSASLGVLILWLGWFGFNPGSTMTLGNGNAISHIIVITNTSAAVGTLAATITAWILLGKPDLSMLLNGCLAGLVAITAACAFVSISSAAIIGLVAGILVVIGVMSFDRLHIDDPVGALSVHLLNGIWGTLALGLFYDEQIATTIAGLPTGLMPLEQTMEQLKGIASVAIWTFSLSLILFWLIRITLGLRVEPEEELEGLDIGEHGMSAYPDFVLHASNMNSIYHQQKLSH